MKCPPASRASAHAAPPAPRAGKRTLIAVAGALTTRADLCNPQEIANSGERCVLMVLCFAAVWANLGLLRAGGRLSWVCLPGARLHSLARALPAFP